MFSTIRNNLPILLIVFTLSFANGQNRQISSQLNPGCKDCTVNDTLIYIKAVGYHDTVHQIWDFTRGIPSMMFAIGTVNSSLTITWDQREPEKFEMSETPRYSFAAAIDKLYEYNDVEDLGYITPNTSQRAYSLRHVTWWRNQTRMADSEAMAKVIGRFKDEGSVEIKLDLLPFTAYADELPHLIHNPNTTLIDIALVNLTTSRDYNSSRFALHFVLASTDSSTDTMRYAMRKSLDDEHTPGVFEIVEIKTPESSTGADGGFLQFRPVGYTQRERGVTSSTNARVSNFNRTFLHPDTTLKRFFSAADRDRLLVQDMFISFGDTGDKFYKEHNYTAWSFTIGYGAPPLEGFSLFVILIISVGLSVPVCLALSGVIYVLVRKYKARNSPTRFTDDE